MKAKRTAKAAFDLKGFLTKTEVGRAPVDYAEKAVIFAQGDPANAVFYIQKGRSNSPSFRYWEMKRWAHFWAPATSLVKDAWQARSYGWQRPSACPSSP
jgi:hypothetical protein